MKFNTIAIAILTLTFSQITLAGHHEKGENSNESVAKSWIEARFAGKQENINFVTKHMASDGLIYAGRYVGFGFSYDPLDQGTMVVTRTTKDSPASKVLEVGDQFMVVNGVEVNEANMDNLSFRGKPGEAVKATIKRDGKMQNIEVARGIINSISSKSEVLADLSNADADMWSGSVKINESVSNSNVTYVWTTVNDVDDKVDLPFEMHTITRFVFNEAGQVTAIGNLSEDRFVLEQTGYTISR